MNNKAIEFLLEEIKELKSIILYSNDSVDIWFANVKIGIANDLIKKYKSND